jgi:hypothetical protein
MSQKTYNITEKAVQDHLRNLFNISKLGNQKNIKHILDLLLTLPEHSINAILMISMIKEEHVPLKIGDQVTYQPSEYTSSFGDRDILMDKGLMTQDGYIYGIVKMDGSWNQSAEFDPYYVNMKVSFFVWKDNKLSNYEDSVPTFDLKIIDELPEFNSPDLQDFLVIEEEATILLDADIPEQ